MLGEFLGLWRHAGSDVTDKQISFKYHKTARTLHYLI